MNELTALHPALNAIIQSLATAAALPAETLVRQLGRPPKPEMGDYALPCFAYAKAAKIAPPLAAAQLAEKLQADPALSGIVDKVETAGAFLNFRVNPGALSQSILKTVLSAGKNYGHTTTGAGKTVVIDYSAPNIAKPFHVGHLMSTIIGASLVRIFRALGHPVVGVNHLGDWGVQCGFQFLAWQRADPNEREKQLAERGLDYLCDLYIEINASAKLVKELEARLANLTAPLSPEERVELTAQLAKLRPEAEARDIGARTLFKKLEDGDPELRALWERLRKETLTYLQKSYDRLGVKFESDAGEGFYEPQLKPLLAELKASGVAVESEGALVIPMDDAAPKPGKDPKPPFILLKSDEATIYGTRDLAAALYRKKTYDFYKNLYVVDVRQSQHFQMLFKAVAKMGHAWTKDCAHVSFGIMSIKEGDTVLTMSTRGGRMVPLNELLDVMVKVVGNKIHEKNPDLSEEKRRVAAEAVGVGAIVYWVLARRRASNFTFDWTQATDPQGDTGPYLQYAHARAYSIMRKCGSLEPDPNADLLLLSAPEEVAVAKALEDFPRVIEQAAADMEPSLISTYLLELASVFGNFLNKHRVLDSAPDLRASRLALVYAVRTVMREGLALLGVSAPEEM